jgi:hypothetical protein
VPQQKRIGASKQTLPRTQTADLHRFILEASILHEIRIRWWPWAPFSRLTGAIPCQSNSGRCMLGQCQHTVIECTTGAHMQQLFLQLAGRKFPTLSAKKCHRAYAVVPRLRLLIVVLASNIVVLLYCLCKPHGRHARAPSANRQCGAWVKHAPHRFLMPVVLLGW